MERAAPGRSELTRFIEAAKEQALPDSTIVGVLKAGGWAENDIYGALRDYCERATGLSVPVRRGLAGGSRDAFLYLLSYGTLAAWTVALGSILFDAIERMWPDPVMAHRSWEADRRGLSAAVATLIVSFPIYLLTARAIVRYLQADPESAESPIRKWLTYVALLMAASIVIGDLITFVAYFLSGEVTVRFALKVAVVLVLAGGVFWYYVSWLRGIVRHAWFAAAAALVICGGLVAGFSRLGSPAHQRSLQADWVRVRHSRALAEEVRARTDTPPPTLYEMRSDKLDPETGAPYEYRPAGGTAYELCATFTGEGEAGFWSHSAGRHCYRFDITRPVP
jgi:hypothetical protein